MWHVMSCAFPYALSKAFPDFNPSFLLRGEIKDFFPSSLSSKLEKVLALKNLNHAKIIEAWPHTTHRGSGLGSGSSAGSGWFMVNWVEQDDRKPTPEKKTEFPPEKIKIF